MANFDIIDTHISLISGGDTILHDGEIKTVSFNNIKTGGFCGKTIFGDSYKSGYKLVKRIVYKCLVVN